METDAVKNEIGGFGDDRYGISDPVWVTYKLYLDEGKSIEEIAEDVWLEDYEVRQWFSSLGLPRPAVSDSIPERPKSQGYSSLFDYFRDHDGDSFTDMGEQLGTNPDNVRQYYDRYIEFVNYGNGDNQDDGWTLPEQES